MKLSKNKTIQTICQIPESIPGKITSITIQQQRKNRCSIFVDNEFLIGTDALLVSEFKLEKGVQLTADIYKKLWESEQVEKTKLWLMNRLASRIHSSYELRTKAKTKGFRSDWIDLAIQKLNRLGLINDREFAHVFVRDKMNLKKWGPQKIKFELKKKGIANSIIEQVLSEQVDKSQINTQIHSLIEKKKPQLMRVDDVYKRKTKIIQFLSGRGYQINYILEAIDSHTFLKT